MKELSVGQGAVNRHGAEFLLAKGIAAEFKIKRKRNMWFLRFQFALQMRLIPKKLCYRLNSFG
jgi:hypothetical protein